MPSLRTLATLTTLLFAAMAWYTSPLLPSVPEIQVTFSREGFFGVLDQWSPDGVDRFKRHFLIDFPFLVSYGALGYRLATWCFPDYSWRARQGLAYALPVAALLDGTENSLHLWFVSVATPSADAFYLLAGMVASVKWLLIIGFVAVSGHALVTRKCSGS